MYLLCHNKHYFIHDTYTYVFIYDKKIDSFGVYIYAKYNANNKYLNELIDVFYVQSKNVNKKECPKYIPPNVINELLFLFCTESGFWKNVHTWAWKEIFHFFQQFQLYICIQWFFEKFQCCRIQKWKKNRFFLSFNQNVNICDK